MRTTTNGNGHMSKRQEIEALLARGLSVDAIAAKGFSKPYAYQIQIQNKRGGKGRAATQHVAALASVPPPQNIRLSINVMDGDEVIGQITAAPHNVARVVKALSGRE